MRGFTGKFLRNRRAGLRESGSLILINSSVNSSQDDISADCFSSTPYAPTLDFIGISTFLALARFMPEDRRSAFAVPTLQVHQ